MRRTVAIIGALGLALASAGALGMSGSAPRTDRCQVIGGDKLPTETGGVRQVCAAIATAAEAQAPGTDYSVQVRVLSDHILAAQVRMADGRMLPEQKMAISDRSLDRRSIDRFAMAIGEAIGRASGR